MLTTDQVKMMFRLAMCDLELVDREEADALFDEWFERVTSQ